MNRDGRSYVRNQRTNRRIYNQGYMPLYRRPTPSKRTYRYKSRGSLQNSKLDKKIFTMVKKNAIDTQDTQVQYFQRLVTNQNPSEGIYNPVVLQINPTGCDSLLPNYGQLTEGKQEIYVDYINIFVMYKENDVELNDVRRNFARHFIVQKDDNTDADVSEITNAFESSSSLDIVGEAMTAVFKQSSAMWKSNDSGWYPYDAERGTSISIGATVTDIPNFHYPFLKHTMSLKYGKNYQIADNGTLLNFKIPTVVCMATQSNNSEPDVSIGYHFYYKVLA